MFESVGSRIVAYFDALASFDVMGALVLGDAMGFKTQTLLSPGIYRDYVFPWYKKLVDTIYQHGKPIILHWTSPRKNDLRPFPHREGGLRLGPDNG